MTEPRWYRENGNIYFADVGRVGSLLWVAEEDWHTDERCDELLQGILDPPPLWANKFSGINFMEDGK